MTITDRSGTAQTVNELKRLRPFIADSYDRPETAIAKLKSMRNNILNETKFYLDSEGLSYEDYFPQVQNTPLTQTTQVSNYKEGQTATNPQTGQKMIFRGGQWQIL